MLSKIDAAVPSARVSDARDLLEDDAWVYVRNSIEWVDHPVIGRVPIVHSPYTIGGFRPPLLAPPLLGQHTTEVAVHLLGMAAGKIEELIREGVLQ